MHADPVIGGNLPICIPALGHRVNQLVKRDLRGLTQPKKLLGPREGRNV